jgi:DNA repair photolyase
MKEAKSYIPFYSRLHNVYNLEDFSPEIIDEAYLKRLGVKTIPAEETLDGLRSGSELLIRGLRDRTLIPEPLYRTVETDPSSIETEIHNYTGRCPTLTYEINPVLGCGVGCQYCLVTDGKHRQELIAIDNYHLYVKKLLDEKNGAGSENVNHYYYFSPKTEAFQEPTLLTGIAHRILHAFIDHFAENPDSKARLFIASKAGAKHLEYKYDGESILDLFERLKRKMQFNTSVSIMPDAFRDILEPYGAPLDERMKAVALCRERGIQANSALVQPIFTPYLTDDHIKSFFNTLHDAGIINYKPEFLTACMENLALLGQYLGYFDKSLERQLYEDYIRPDNADHRKQRGRTAPSRDLSIASIKRLMAYTDILGMSVSICYWVRKQLNLTEDFIPLINRNGFQCLGYQNKLFQ